jgi:hypothetical protein
MSQTEVGNLIDSASALLAAPSLGRWRDRWANPRERLNIEQKITIMGMVRLMVRIIIFCA